MLDATKLARYFDHTLLNPIATSEQIKTLCNEALEFHFYSVCVHPYYLSACKKILEHSKIKLCTVVGFPLGANTSLSKVSETLDAIKLGAEEIDMVMNLSAFKSKLFVEVENDIKNVVNSAKNLPVKVIIETSYLTTEEIIQATQICEAAGAAFVKTSTGFASRGASLDDIRTIASARKTNIQIKASGGIKDIKTALELIEAGATRLGSSKSVEILKELK
jgi:deoxyribose-phosphate aldolase